ncbi:hypothetical protein Q8A67_006025 [Cirrhinus molitorella]|uniref:Uncharacterized protein n=1 Tax=Cirrhinus molitorella TaxID=172907 RepID=A0AA88Q9M2_9TELE|nr:hypothetical protein Q8A67_006025 [Cirrhinus molitorella]
MNGYQGTRNSARSERYRPKTTDKGPDMKETASCLWHLTMRRAFSVSRVSKVGSGDILDEVEGRIPLATDLVKHPGKA